MGAYWKLESLLEPAAWNDMDLMISRKSCIPEPHPVTCYSFLLAELPPCLYESGTLFFLFFSFPFLLRYWDFFYRYWTDDCKMIKSFLTAKVLQTENCGSYWSMWTVGNSPSVIDFLDKRSESGTCTVWIWYLHWFTLLLIDTKISSFSESYEELIDTKISSFFSILCLIKTSVDIMEASIK